MVWGGVIVLLLAVSILLFLLVGNKFTRRAVFFPNERSLELQGELRRVPRRKDREENIYLLMRELLLGPSDISHARLTPRAAEINTVMFRGESLYLDFSPDVLFEDKQRPIPFDLVLIGIKQTVTFNFPAIQDIRISVDGVPVEDTESP